MNHKVYLTKSFTFESSHHLPEHKGKCHNLHGHSYKLFVTVSGKCDEKTGMVIDFSDIKKIVEEHIVSLYDHSLLNDYFPNPTAEIMVVHIFYKLKDLFPNTINIENIKLYETETSFAEFRGEYYNEN